MANPFDCPLPTERMCPHTGTISTTQAQMNVILDALHDIKADVRELKNIAPDIKSQHEALGRAFGEIEKLEKKLAEHEGVLLQFEGMKKLAMALWTVLAGGLGLVILKVFSL